MYMNIYTWPQLPAATSSCLILQGKTCGSYTHTHTYTHIQSQHPPATSSRLVLQGTICHSNMDLFLCCACTHTHTHTTTLPPRIFISYHVAQWYHHRTHLLYTYPQLATTWLNGNIENIIAVHCLGGKGRTGTLCVSLLLWTGFLNSKEEALSYFQNRYLCMYAHMWISLCVYA